MKQMVAEESMARKKPKIAKLRSRSKDKLVTIVTDLVALAARKKSYYR